MKPFFFFLIRTHKNVLISGEAKRFLLETIIHYSPATGAKFPSVLRLAPRARVASPALSGIRVMGCRDKMLPSPQLLFDQWMWSNRSSIHVTCTKPRRWDFFYFFPPTSHFPFSMESRYRRCLKLIKTLEHKQAAGRRDQGDVRGGPPSHVFVIWRENSYHLRCCGLLQSSVIILFLGRHGVAWQGRLLSNLDCLYSKEERCITTPLLPKHCQSLPGLKFWHCPVFRFTILWLQEGWETCRNRFIQSLLALSDPIPSQSFLSTIIKLTVKGSHLNLLSCLLLPWLLTSKLRMNAHGMTQ